MKCYLVATVLLVSFESEAFQVPGKIGEETVFWKREKSILLNNIRILGANYVAVCISWG